MTEQQEQKFEQWAIVELMGHRRLAAKVTEQVIAGQAMLRIDVPQVEVECRCCQAGIPIEGKQGGWKGHVRRLGSGTEQWADCVKETIPGFTQFYGPQAIYCLTPTTEEVARAIAARIREKPVQPYEIRQLAAHSTVYHDVPDEPLEGEPDDAEDDPNRQELEEEAEIQREEAAEEHDED